MASPSNPQDASKRNERGLECLKQRNYDEAEREFTKAIQLDPKFAVAYINLGGLYRKQGKYTKAERKYKEAIRLDPNFSMAHSNLGVLYHEEKKYAEAEKELKEAIRLDPTSVASYLNLGNLYREQGKYAEGGKKLDEALRLEAKIASRDDRLEYAVMTSMIQTRDKEQKPTLENFNFSPDALAIMRGALLFFYYWISGLSFF